MSLHDDIITLKPPFSIAWYYTTGMRDSYEQGHRDARHAAAELALAKDAEVDALRAEVERLRAALSSAKLLEPCAYQLDDEAKIELARQRDGSVLWAVRQSGTVLAADGLWEHEPMPSSRDDDFIKRCRFPTAEAAHSAWLATRPSAPVLGAGGDAK